MPLYLRAGAFVGIIERFLEVEERQLVLPLQVHDPSVCVKKHRVVRFRADSESAHPLRLLEVAAVRSQIIGVVIEHGDIVRVERENLVIHRYHLLAFRADAFHNLQAEEKKLYVRRIVLQIAVYLRDGFLGFAPHGVDTVPCYGAVAVIAAQAVLLVLDTQSFLPLCGTHIQAFELLHQVFVRLVFRLSLIRLFQHPQRLSVAGIGVLRQEGGAVFVPLVARVGLKRFTVGLQCQLRLSGSVVEHTEESERRAVVGLEHAAELQEGIGVGITLLVNGMTRRVPVIEELLFALHGYRRRDLRCLLRRYRHCRQYSNNYI